MQRAYHTRSNAFLSIIVLFAQIKQFKTKNRPFHRLVDDQLKTRCIVMRQWQVLHDHIISFRTIIHRPCGKPWSDCIVLMVPYICGMSIKYARYNKITLPLHNHCAASPGLEPPNRIPCDVAAIMPFLLKVIRLLMHYN